METSRLTVKNIFLNSCLSPQNWQEFVLKSCLKQSFVIKKKQFGDVLTSRQKYCFWVA